jgi:hypothetical protein
LSKSRQFPEEGGVNLKRAVSLTVSIPSQSVALVKNGCNRSARLPTRCDVCQEVINEYPFIAKESSGYRKCHVECALKVGVVSLVTTA